MSNYGNENDVRDCYLEGRMDLYTAETAVQDVIADYLNDLLDTGVAGFRIDAATHIWPEVSIGYSRLLLVGAEHVVLSPTIFSVTLNNCIYRQDLEYIQAKTNNLSEAAGFPSGASPYFYYDVIAPGTAITPADYYHLGV